MQDRIVNDIFTHPRLGTLKVEECPDGDCGRCVFSNNGGVCSNDTDMYHTGQCSREYRIDKTDVIFVKPKEEGGTV